MPRRGDNLEAITASATIDHLSNATVVITPKKYLPAGHPNSKSVQLNVIRDVQYVEEEGVGGYVTTYTMLESDIEKHGLGEGDMVTDKGRKMLFREPQESGDGVAVIMLEEYEII